MGFDGGQVLLDSDNGAYYAGQTVRGRLIFDQTKPKTIYGIYVSFKGFCKVHWTTTETRKENDRDVTETIDHDSFEEYFNKKIYLFGNPDEEYHLNAGHHEFNFDFPLPMNLPSSFEAELGHIRYRIKAVMHTSGMFSSNKEKTVAVRVITPVDLNQIAFCKEPIDIEMINSYCCWCVSSGSSEVRVKVPVSGFCPGQVIPVEASISNLSGVTIDMIKFEIRRTIRFEATQRPATRTDYYTVASIAKGPVGAGTTPSWNLEMPIKPMEAYNFDSCKYIDINYTFSVTAEVGGCHQNDEQSHRVLIGNIPLVGFQDNVDNPHIIQMPAPAYYPDPAIVVQPQPMVAPNQTYPSSTTYPYPGNQPYPNQGNPPYSPNQGNPPYSPNQGQQPYPYPGNQPYPNPGFQPYPANQPFPNPGNQPFPNPGNQPFPNPGNQPYINPGNQPYPNPGNQPFSNPDNKAYPDAPPPYPGGNLPQPTAPIMGFVAGGDTSPLLPPDSHEPKKSNPSAPSL